jgi:hypothetical protein
MSDKNDYVNSYVCPARGISRYTTLVDQRFQRTDCNESPRNKLRDIPTLKHSKRPEIFPRLPLPLHIKNQKDIFTQELGFATVSPLFLW